MERMEIKQYPSGRIVGFIEIDSNGDKTVKEFSGRILGYYRKSRNGTFDFYGRQLAFGDVTGIFFKQHFNF